MAAAIKLVYLSPREWHPPRSARCASDHKLAIVQGAIARSVT
jgi:hypothetical protein